MTVATHAPAFAQNADAGEWHRGTALSLFGGAASTSDDTNAAFGAALAWEFTPRWTIEGSGLWADGPDASSSFAAFISARANLRPRRTVVPFATGGVGLYRTSFGTDMTHAEPFYRHRMDPAMPLQDREFTDLALAVGGGVDVFVHRHLALRPDVRVFLVTADSSVHPVTVWGVHVAYHFESHNVTPTRRAR
jgi:hypothetical protein